VDHAEKLLASVNVAIAKARGKATNTAVQPAVVTPQRLAATRGLFKAAEWKAWPQFLSNVEPIDPAWDTLINLSNWFRNKETGIAKDDAAAAPSLDAALGKLAEAKAKRETAKTAVERVGARPAKTLASVVEDLTALQTIEKDKKAHGFLTAALKSLESYEPYVAKREEEAELAKVKAKHAAKRAKADGK
jgi:hypothetical protein